VADEVNDDKRFILRPTLLEGVIEVEFCPMVDERGSFTRVFAAEGFAATKFFPQGPVHINMSTTLEAGTVRGLHWQEDIPGISGEAKLVFCVSGRIFDIAADVRRDSSTRLKYVAIELTPTANRALLVPPGVAHGIQALEDNSMLLYVNAAPFRPEFERGARYDDPALCIEWPLPVRNVSERDSLHPSLNAFIGP
jgi:dTDP-4-dehydrorhamnose 3,5-epimerase